MLGFFIITVRYISGGATLVHVHLNVRKGLNKLVMSHSQNANGDFHMMRRRFAKNLRLNHVFTAACAFSRRKLFTAAGSMNYVQAPSQLTAFSEITILKRAFGMIRNGCAIHYFWFIS